MKLVCMHTCVCVCVCVHVHVHACVHAQPKKNSWPKKKNFNQKNVFFTIFFSHQKPLKNIFDQKIYFSPKSFNVLSINLIETSTAPASDIS